MNARGKGWHTLDPMLLQENTPMEGGSITSPSLKAFDTHATQITVAYKSNPLIFGPQTSLDQLVEPGEFLSIDLTALVHQSVALLPIALLGILW